MTTTSCAGTNTIAALLAGAIDADAAARLELHLDRCPACRVLVANLGRGLTAIGEAGAPSSPAQLPQPGEQIGRYEIRRVVGVGGMGVVYEAHDTTLDRRVAVKLLRPDLLEGVSLLAEAQAMARLQHPNIVTVFDVGIANGQLYVCMEYVAGTTLRAWADQCARSWREIALVYAAAGEGLAYVHRAGLVHLDFKPDNVLVDREGRARVTDFGLARMIDARPAHGARLLVGTPAYMAPEQRRCETTDARCDQYAFCASLRETLGDRDVPSWLQRVIARGLSIDRARRFATMADLLATLHARLAPRRRRLGGALVIAAASAIAIVLSMPQGAARPRVIERPTTVVVDRPVVHLVNAASREAEPRAAVGQRPAPTIAASSPMFAAPARRDVMPALATLASLASSRPVPMVHAEPSPTASSSSEASDETGEAGFTTELGLCDDGSLRTCSVVMPVCPADTLVAVQAGCWTCADVQTCAPLGLPRTCNDGTPLRCTRERPTCEGRRIAAVRNGCWSCEDPFTCWSHASPTKPPPRPPVCGNHACERGETDRSCAVDCGSQGSGGGSNTGSNGSGAATCGNGFCESGEDHASCATDCCETGSSGACLPQCGNQFCEEGETTATCASDCS